MKYLLLLFPLLFQVPSKNPGFLAEQKKFSRVKSAFAEKENALSRKLSQIGIEPKELNLLLVGLKYEKLLYVFVKNKQGSRYQFFDSIPVCALSGELGPKRMQGDLQVPEGFYFIDRFNSQSWFHLSLGLNYPNLADRRKKAGNKLGGDIFIHGECVSAGCLALTNEPIKELYVLSVWARNSGQFKIPVYLFPFHMDAANRENFRNLAEEKDLLGFWEDLAVGYTHFFNHKQELNYSFDSKGNYRIKKKN